MKAKGKTVFILKEAMKTKKSAEVHVVGHAIDILHLKTWIQVSSEITNVTDIMIHSDM